MKPIIKFVVVLIFINLFACNSKSKDSEAVSNNSNETEQVNLDETTDEALDSKAEDEDSQILDIRNKFQATEKDLNSFSKKYTNTEEDGLITELTGYYNTQNIPVKVITLEAMGHGSFKRSFYTNNGNLYFMFEEEVSEASIQGPYTYRQKRMYINDGKLIRILTKEKTITDDKNINFKEIKNTDATKSITDKQKEINNYNAKLSKALKTLSLAKTVGNESSISFTNGRWISTDDPKSGIEIKNNKWILFYKEGVNESNNVYNYAVSKTTTNSQTENSLKITNESETMEYSILSYTDNKLELMYLPRGNILSYIPEHSSKSVGLEVFTKFPSELEGCSCSFGKALKDMYNRKYSYADNFEDTAMISINGKMTTFKLTKAEPYSENSITKTFVNDDYTLKLEVNKTGTSDYQTLYKGIVTLSKVGKIVAKEIVEGSCGC